MFMTPADLRARFLRGMPLPDEKGRPISDDVLTANMQATAAAFQRRYAVRLAPCVIQVGRAAPDPAAPAPDEVLDGLPFLPRTWEESRHASLKLPIGPVRAVHSVGLRLPGQARLTTFPQEWIQVDHRSRTVQLYPGSTLTVMPLAMTGFGMAAVHSGRAIPGAWHITYDAGYTDADYAGNDADVAQALGQLTTISLLIPGSIDRFLAQGVAGLSVSVDGLSNSTQLLQSGGNIKYGALIQAYRDSLQVWEKLYDQRRSGVIMGFV